jgi:Tfp pilus assembly PilM family ATPase
LRRFLILDWDHQRLNVVTAAAGRGSLHIEHLLSLDEPQSPNPAEAEAQGRLLAERLKSAGISGAPTIVCVGRDRVILKSLTLPPSSPADEPALVRFQVVKELTDAPDEVVIDYAASPNANGAGNRVLAVVLRRELLTAYQALCQGAGLKLIGVSPRPFGEVACVADLLHRGVLPRSQDRPQRTIGIVALGGTWAEFSIANGEELIFARALTAGPGMAADIRRNLAVHAAQASSGPVEALYLTGQDLLPNLRQELTERTSLPVLVFDPLQGRGSVGRPATTDEIPADRRGQFAGAMGLLATVAEGRPLPINLLKPKQPRPATNPNKRRLLIGAAAAIAIVASIFTYGYVQLDRRDQLLRSLADEKAGLDSQLAGLADEIKYARALDEWTNSEIDWLDELYDLTDRFPDPNNVRLVQFTGDPMTRTVKNSHVARIVMKGIMNNDYQALNQLESRLVNDGHYRVEPKVLGRNTAADRFRFPQQFITRVEVEKLPPDKYVRRITPPSTDDTSATGFGDTGFGPGGPP